MNVGIGLYLLKNGCSYEGSTINWQLTGLGKLISPDNSIYKGELLGGIKHGIGHEIFADGT